MKRKGCRLIAGIICLLILPMLMGWIIFGAPVCYREIYLGALQDKLDTLEQTTGKRVIIAGGSGAAFALRSDLLENELPGYQVINLGMYAGLGSTVPLELMEQQLRAGDVIVFLPEQNKQTLSMYFGSEAMWQAADGRPELLSKLNKMHIRSLLGELPYFAAQKLSCLLRGDIPVGDGVYARNAFNRWGDIESPLRETNTMPGGFDINTSVDFSDQVPTDDFIDYVNAYAARCTEKQVTFLFAFCPMNRAAVADMDLPEVYQARIKQLLTCPVIGSIQESILEPAWFYDTNFHLNADGAILYTARLAEDIKEAINISGQGTIQVPAAPAEHKITEAVGDDSQADAFLYREEGEGVVIIGLSDTGLAAESLIIPTHALGKPVTGFEQEVFARNQRITCLTLQANIRTIPNGAFSGCSALKRICMSGIRPDQCTVGEALLEGTNAEILVEQDLLASYQTNYFWAVHARRIHAMEMDSPIAASVAETTAEPEMIPENFVEITDTLTDNILYDGNGGHLAGGEETTLAVPFNSVHLRMNTLPLETFVQQGYVQTGWSKSADGTDPIGPGSRAALAPGDKLYAVWAKETDPAAFTWRADNEEIWITGFTGGDCVIPSELDGLPVVGIAGDAFKDMTLECLILPSSIRTVEEGAFRNCTIHTMYLTDAVTSIGDACFDHCTGPNELHISAATAPAYSISYYATFADKYDRLLSLQGQRKLVLFAGSSTRYGYDSAKLAKAFPGLGVVNMGVYAYTNALPQMLLILKHMETEDVLLHAPEFDPLISQFCVRDDVDLHFWAMMEANYDAAAELDLSAFTHVFDGFSDFLRIRAAMPERSYQDTPNDYDDDGYHHTSSTYNRYGDFCVPREGNKMDVMLNHTKANYTPDPFTPEVFSRMNAVYTRYLEKGIQVLFAYNPRNRSSLTEESTPERRAALDRLLREQLIVPIINDMEDSLMSGVYFFLIDSHLSSEGVRVRMNQLVPALQQYILVQ